ncbi:MAG: hypothetical protein AAGB48_10485 [Planctomycetota bacterium]
MVFVLGLTVLVTVSTLGLARSMALRARSEDRIGLDRIIADLQQAAQSPIESWLADVADETYLPADAAEPRFDVLDDAWSWRDHAARVRITAWDQYGMAPWTALDGSPRMRSLLPEALRVRSTQTSNLRPGLDLFTSNNAFPEPRDNRALQVHPQRLGAFLATHNPPWSRATEETPPAINLNTAPASLVRAALRLAGRGGADAILEQRERGRSGLGGLETAASKQSESPIRLVGTSDAWSFRLDIEYAGVRRSWWLVYIRDRQGGNNNSGDNPRQQVWRLAQRHAIPS